MVFKVDTHVHTSESSSCGRVPGAQMAAIYADAGYDAMVVCDHYYDGFFHEKAHLDWPRQVDRYLRGYRAVREASETLGVGVFLGVELRLQDSLNDYLVFGLDEEYLYANPRLYRLPLWEVRQLLDQVGALLVQAHPFRPRMVRADPEVLHGVEVMNGHPNHSSDNPSALQWARQHGLLMTGGSDAHFLEGVLRVHMQFERALTDGADLARAIRAREAVEIVGPEGASVAPAIRA